MFGHVVDVGAGKSLPVHVLLISITRRYCFMKFVSTEHVFLAFIHVKICTTAVLNEGTDLNASQS